MLAAIDRALRGGACWIAAPAGYGKTIAVTDYLQRARRPFVWYRVDEGDQDVASFFHYLALSVRGRGGSRLPAFGPEYADQLLPFARRFFRAWFAALRPRTLVVFDDLHDADSPPFRQMLAVLLDERPDEVRCVFASRTMPPDTLAARVARGGLAVVDEAVLRFSDREAHALVRKRLGRSRSRVDAARADGWAAAIVLIAEQSSLGPAVPQLPAAGRPTLAASFAALAGQLIDGLPPDERDLLMKVSLLTEIRPELVAALGGRAAAEALIDALRSRQLLATRGQTSHTVFHLHDLLRDYLRERLAAELPPEALAALRVQAARAVDEAGDRDAAIELAIQAQAWALARQLLAAQADTLIAQGRRETLVERCAALPPHELDGWLCYWLGVATAPDDATAEQWFSRAWEAFSTSGDDRGLCLTAAHAVLAKADSWRTHEGLAVWTERAIALAARDVAGLSAGEQMLAWTGMLRAIDFAAAAPADADAVERLTRRLADRLAAPDPADTVTQRLFASEALIEHAGTTGQPALFERAVDSVAADLRAGSASPWALGLWLVAFGAISGRYFPYARRGFPYASPEDALRAAMAIGEREALRGVEFGALYHLQLQMKARNDFTGFGVLIKRLAEIADSRYTTQVAVVADCQAALHTIRGDFVEAHAACARFMAAIEAANEPPLERWPHFITNFQVLLGERRAAEAAAFLSGFLPLFSGAIRQRTEACVRLAHACEARWSGSAAYPDRLRDALGAVREANWPAVMLNLPGLLSELCADALEHGIEPELCRSLIARRRLAPPAGHPARWPWALRIHMLGGFALERDGERVDLGQKPPTRSLEIVQALAAAREHACTLEQLCDWLWPDADGAQAKAACEQALHRLRRLLGRGDLIVHREGTVRLAPDAVWVDLDYWDTRLAGGDLERAVAEFPGPLAPFSADAPWLMPAAERVRRTFIDAALRLGKSFEARHDWQRACDVYMRIVDIFPTSERACEALIEARLAMGDAAGAVEDYQRCERAFLSASDGGLPPALRALAVRARRGAAQP